MIFWHIRCCFPLLFEVEKDPGGSRKQSAGDLAFSTGAARLAVMVPPIQSVDLSDCDWRCRLELASRIAYEAAREPWLRRIALDAVGRVRNVPRQGPERLAKWVRRSIRYAWELPGVEVLQGPITTLQTGVGDCDDTAILWASLCLSLGLEAWPAGVGVVGRWPHHSVGLDPINGVLWDLNQDGAFTPQGRHAFLRYRLPSGYYATAFDVRRGMWIDFARGCGCAGSCGGC